MSPKTASQAPSVHVEVIKIGDARSNLPQMVTSLESGERAGYVVGPYGRPSAALVSFERFRPLLAKGSKKERFALLIADELLPEAPQHLWASAIQELSRLPKSDLIKLWRLTEASGPEEFAAIRAHLQHPEALDRLLARIRVASAISQARKEGLYEAAEDLTGDIDLAL